MITNYKLFETDYYINLTDKNIDNNKIEYNLDKIYFQRLKKLLNELNENDSSIISEKIVEILLNSVNLNYYNTLYNLVDLYSITDNTYISVKFSKNANNFNSVIGKSPIKFYSILSYLFYKINKKYSKNNSEKFYKISNIILNDDENEYIKYLKNIPYYILMIDDIININNLTGNNKIFEILLKKIYNSYHKKIFKIEKYNNIKIPTNLKKYKKELNKYNDKIFYALIYIDNKKDYIKFNLAKTNYLKYNYLLIKSINVFIKNKLYFGSKQFKISDFFEIYDIKDTISIYFKNDNTIKIDNKRKDIMIKTINSIKNINNNDNNDKNNKLLKYILTLLGKYNNSTNKDEYIKKFKNFLNNVNY